MGRFFISPQCDILRYMAKIIRILVLVSILALSIGFFVSKNKALVARYNPFSEYKCNIPVTYAVGTVDPRFGVSQEKFMGLAREAEKDWEKALGRNLFEMKTDGRVKVNLVFDDRQVQTEELKKIMADIESGKEKSDKLFSEYEALRTQLDQKKISFNQETKNYEKEKNDFSDAADQYQKDLKDYEQSVEYWNSNGGANGKDYDKLIKRQKELDQQYKDLKNQEKNLKTLYDALDKKRADINALVTKVNALADVVNRISGNTNQKVEDYNQTQAERGEFETGLYSNINGVESIDIYQFFDDKDLLAVLIHEMGHALGLGHAIEKTAIMYPKLINQSTEITSDDRALFRTTCLKKN